MKWIDDEKELRGKRVLVRVDSNAPVESGVVTDTFRIDTLLPTIEFLKASGARTILLGHLGRDKETSIIPVYNKLSEHISVSFVPDIVGSIARDAVEKMQDGDIILLENVRRDEREVQNDDGFASELASLADIYVNEAFAVSHRKHASIVGVPKYLPSFGGKRLRDEIETLTKVQTPQHPALFILGGAKFETKLPLIEKFSDIYDEVFVCGALANNFFRAQGLSIGSSLISGADIDMTHVLARMNISLPTDAIVSDGVNHAVRIGEIQSDERILDAGPETVSRMIEKIQGVHCVLWNGPLGEYENGFGEGTEALARAIAESGVHSVIGGGDTAAAVTAFGLKDAFTFISTGGGAMLEFLLKGTLPGIEALGD